MRGENVMRIALRNHYNQRLKLIFKIRIKCLGFYYFFFFIYKVSEDDEIYSFGLRKLI